MARCVADGSTNSTKRFEPTGSEPEPTPRATRRARARHAYEARQRGRYGAPGAKIDLGKIARLEAGASSSLT